MILNVVVGVVVGSGHDGGSGCDGGGICGCLDGGGCDGGNDDVVIEATVVMAMVRMVGVMGLVVIWWVITVVVVMVAGAMVMMMVMSLLERHLSRRSTPRFSGICRQRLRS